MLIIIYKENTFAHLIELTLKKETDWSKERSSENFFYSIRNRNLKFKFIVKFN